MSVPPADHLTPAELAELTAYNTAPETASPAYQHFDTMAQQKQSKWRWLFWWSLGVLAAISCISTATDLGTVFGWSPGWVRWANITGILLTSIGVGFELYYQTYLRRHLHPWATARDKAETLRSAVWLYLLDLPLPTAATPTSTDADAAWQHLTHGLLARATLAPAVAPEPGPALLQWRQRFRDITPAERLRAYCAARLTLQRDYYIRRSAALRTRAKICRYLIGGLLTLALLWNGLRVLVLFQDLRQWLPYFTFNSFVVLIGFVGLLKAYIESEDLEPLAARYEQMRDNLRRRTTECPQGPLAPAAFQQFITESERILRDETIEWSTKRGDPLTPVL